MIRIYKAIKIVLIGVIFIVIAYLPTLIPYYDKFLDEGVGIYPEMNGLAYTDVDNDRQAYLLHDGNYLIADVKKVPLAKYISILKTDSDNSIRLYNLNIRLTEKSKIASRNKQYIGIQPFQSDYIENDISTEPLESNDLSAVKNFYFLHVENGYGVIFQKSLKIPYTENHEELAVKIHEAALNAGYISE